MFGLFMITVDYYTWEDLVCVSESEEKLVDYYNEEKRESDIPLNIEGQDHRIKYDNTGAYGFLIRKVERI